MSKTLLLTGFEPFGEETVNPSGQVVALMPDVLGDIRIYKLILPVSFAGAGAAVREAITRLSPEAVLSLGQAGGRKALTIEKVALNLASGKTNHGEALTGAEIDRRRPAAYFSTLPVAAMAAAVRAAGVPCEISYFAGTYVCNYVLFTALCAARKKSPRCGFIHLPYSLEQGLEKSVPTMGLKDMAAGVEAAIATAFAPADEEALPSLSS